MDYLSSFMNTCINSGKSSVSDITEAAKIRIKDIEFQLSNFDDLKKEEKILKSLIKQLNGDFDSSSMLEVETGSDFHSLPGEIQSICLSILELLEDQEAISVRFIIDTISDLEDTKLVLTSLKWLIDNKIVSRSEVDRKFSKGDLWSEKEKLTSITSLKN